MLYFIFVCEFSEKDRTIYAKREQDGRHARKAANNLNVTADDDFNARAGLI